MDVLFTVKIKGKNVPEFKKGLGKGVLAKMVITYDSKEFKTMSGPRQLIMLLEQENKILSECVESSFEVLHKKRKKKHYTILPLYKGPAYKVKHDKEVPRIYTVRKKDGSKTTVVGTREKAMKKGKIIHTN